MAAGRIPVVAPHDVRKLLSLTDVGDEVGADTVPLAHKNVADGPATLYSVRIESTGDGSNNVKIWVKFYNIVDTTLVAGDSPSAPDLIVPIRTEGTAAAVKVESFEIPEGLYFSNGISVMASAEDGNTLTAGPNDATPLDVYLSYV